MGRRLMAILVFGAMAALMLAPAGVAWAAPCGINCESPPPGKNPYVNPISPEPDTSTADRTPTIRAEVEDGRTNLAASDIRLFVDGRRIARFAYNRSANRLAYTPAANLSFGRHDVKITATDAQGNVGREVWEFRVVRGGDACGFGCNNGD